MHKLTFCPLRSCFESGFLSVRCCWTWWSKDDPEVSKFESLFWERAWLGREVRTHSRRIRFSRLFDQRTMIPSSLRRRRSRTDQLAGTLQRPLLWLGVWRTFARQRTLSGQGCCLCQCSQQPIFGLTCIQFLTSECSCQPMSFAQYFLYWSHFSICKEQGRVSCPKFIFYFGSRDLRSSAK